MAAAPSRPIPTVGLAPASGVWVAVTEARADVTRLDAEATSVGSGSVATSAQISVASVPALVCSSVVHELEMRMQGPMALMKAVLLGPHRQSKSVGPQLAELAAELKQLKAHVGI